ncbi:hypothetical protein Mapa_001568 [Marchantia paleacea]|nr:hypothetical protein Mapa_001568 [Marchantia paleacea]
MFRLRMSSAQLLKVLLLLVFVELVPAAHWGEAEKGECYAATSGEGLRIYSARLWDIQGDWMTACDNTPNTIEGIEFGRNSHMECQDDAVFGMYGKFYVPDPTCPSCTVC